MLRAIAAVNEKNDKISMLLMEAGMSYNKQKRTRWVNSKVC